MYLEKLRDQVLSLLVCHITFEKYKNNIFLESVKHFSNKTVANIPDILDYINAHDEPKHFFLFINTKQFLSEFLMIQPKKKEVVQLSQFE